MENEPKQQFDKENMEVYKEYMNVIDNQSETGKEMKKQIMNEVKIKDNTSDFTYQIDTSLILIFYMNFKLSFPLH